MKQAVLVLAALFALVGAAPGTTFNITVVNPTGQSVTPVSSDALVEMVGADTHFGAYEPYTNVTAVKTLLTGSNFRHVRDGGPGPLPTAIGNGAALNIPGDSPYHCLALSSTCIQTDLGNGNFGETACSVAAKISTKASTYCSDTGKSYSGSPNGDYIEMCANEQDNDSKIANLSGTSDPKNQWNANGDNWPQMLAGCITEEMPWVIAANTRHLPIVLPPLADSSRMHFLVSALGSSGLSVVHNANAYANLHFSTVSYNPETSVVTPLSTAVGWLNLIAPHFYVTEFSYDQRLTPTIDNSIYGRTNAIPMGMIGAYDVRALLAWQNLGATRVYFYQFTDVPSDCTFGGDGLSTATLTGPSSSITNGYQDDGCGGTSYTFASGTNAVVPKTSYTAVNNYLGLVADPGGEYNPSPLNISLAPSSSSRVQHVVFQKRNGTVLVALWRAETDYDYVNLYTCPLGASAVPPPNNGSHAKSCTVTSESATVSIPGYTESRVDTFQPNGSISYDTTSLPSTIQLKTPYVTVVEFTPS